MNLKNNNKNFIDGRWVDGNSDIYNLRNPYDNTVITALKLANQEQVYNAFSAASNAYKAWSSNPTLRKEVLTKVKKYFDDNNVVIIKLLAVESVSTYVKRKLEIDITIECITASLIDVDVIGAK
ncbi:aldehyde dehydrogenase family protein, partial [Staphylococcus aureus]|uniref:aldehyde dehydrogenase family protein n=1 Tax=Staphylococcus aureus TaxID=1280 RepID=UPI0030F46EB3